MNSMPDILFEELKGQDGTIGLITLRRQQALNALNHAMFLALYQQLDYWQQSPMIKAVVIHAAEGRAFCAGGDIRYAYELKQNSTDEASLSSFFSDEYRMDRLIYHYKKPYIALLDGITMGGGVGLSVFASHRIATERMIFAMPETGIGFYPDVGGSYFLSRLPHYIGYYLGLTGVTISYSDCAALGLVDYVIASNQKASIISALVESSLPDIDAISRLLNSFTVQAPPSTLLTHHDLIERCFSKAAIDDILQALYHLNDPWCATVANTILMKSPTSLKVTLEALQRGAKQDYDTCMDMELLLTTHFIHSHDFFEGIRAAVIDKDRKPKWQPSRLQDVTMEQVNSYFKR